MNRYDILQQILKKETGKYFDGKAIWEEIECKVGEYVGENGETWITGQDNDRWKWQYYIDIERSYDKEYDQWNTDIHILEIVIEDKEENKRWHVDINNVTL